MPPVVAIVLALITKEVYSSLFVGIATAALFYAQFHIVDAYTTMFRDGFIASLSDSSHVGILIFLVVLGTIVVLMNRAGGSAAYGKWAQKRIKTRNPFKNAPFPRSAVNISSKYGLYTTPIYFSPSFASPTEIAPDKAVHRLIDGGNGLDHILPHPL